MLHTVSAASSTNVSTLMSTVTEAIEEGNSATGEENGAIGEGNGAIGEE